MNTMRSFAFISLNGFVKFFVLSVASADLVFIGVAQIACCDLVFIGVLIACFMANLAFPSLPRPIATAGKVLVSPVVAHISGSRFAGGLATSTVAQLDNVGKPSASNT